MDMTDGCTCVIEIKGFSSVCHIIEGEPRMKRIIVICSMILLVAAVITVVVFSISQKPEVIRSGSSVMTEIKDTEQIILDGMRTPFVLSNCLTGNAHQYTPAAFTGTVKDIKTYSVSWVSDAGETNGPFTINMLTVSIKRDYNSNLPEKEIKALMQVPLSEKSAIRTGEDYVFLNGWLLDDTYFENARKIGAETAESAEKDISLHQADVIFGGEWNSVFLIKNDNVELYYEYLSELSNTYERDGEAILVPYSEFESVYRLLLAEAEKELGATAAEMRSPFSLKNALTGNNGQYDPAAFMGKITNVESLNVSWINDQGETEGPFKRTLLTISVSRDYNSNLPESEIKALMFFPFSEDSAIRTDGDYIFLNGWLLNETYFENAAKTGAETAESAEKDTSLHQADVILGGEWNSIFEVSGDCVAVYYEYLSGIEHSFHRVGERILVPTIQFDEFYEMILNQARETAS